MPSSVAVAVVSGAFAGVAASVGAGVLAGAVFTSAFMSAFVSSLVLSGLSAALSSGQGGSSQQDQPQASSIANSGRTVTIRQAVSPWRVIYGKIRVGGTVTYKKVTGENRYYHLVITFAGHVSEEIVAVHFSDEAVPLDGDGEATGKYAGYVRIKKSLGAEAGQPFPDLNTESGGEWTDAHRQTGHTKLWVRIKASSDLFPTGIPNITAVIKGKNDIYDPRTGLTGWSENPALCVNNYLTDAVRGVGVVYAEEINATDLIAAANICDESVSLAGGGSEKRYTCNGDFLTTEKPVDILGKLTSSMAGYAVQIGAKWNIIAGAYEVPTLEFDEGDLAGPLQWQSLVSRRDSCNAVKGIYVDPANNWQPTDFPAVISDTYQALDNGERVYHDLELNFTNSGTMAQRMAKIELLRTRQGLTVKWPGKLSCYRAQPGKTIKLTFAKYGWNAKPFFVTDGTFSINADGSLGYTLALRETAAAIYDWNTSEEQTVDFAPNTDLGDPFTVAALTGLTLSSGTTDLLMAGDGTVISRLKAVWTETTDSFVLNGGHVLLQVKKSADTIWQDATPSSGDGTLAYLLPVVDGVAYDVRIRAENAIGVRSAWTTVTGHTVIGKTALPADVPWFSINRNVVAWGTVADIDLAGYLIRWQSGANTSWGDANPAHEGVLTSSPYTLLSLPNIVLTLLIKAVDTTGNASANAASIISTTITGLGDVIVSNVIVTTDFHDLGFPGTIVNGAVSPPMWSDNANPMWTADGDLMWDISGDLFATPDPAPLAWSDDAANYWTADADLMWDVQTYMAMTYTTEAITVAAADAGSQMTLTSSIEAGSYLVEFQQQGLKSMWSTDTDPMWTDDADPLWKPNTWQSWPGSLTASADVYQFRISTNASATEGRVRVFKMLLDVPDISETLADIAISAGGTRLPITKTYRSIKAVNLTLQSDGGAARTARVEDKLNTGPLVLCLNSSGTGTSGKIDGIVQGY